MPCNVKKPFNGQISTSAARFAILLSSLIALCTVVVGCGSGGYAGNGISSLSSSAITIDAGQSFQITADGSGTSPISWSLSGSSCTASACGTLSSTTGSSVTYTAPAGIAASIKLTATATITGTNSSSVANITVNPDPVISGTPPAANVGVPYTATLTATGGTAPLTWSLNGSLPAGLTFNSKTGVITGTPTTAGSSNVTAQIVDSSDVPYTVKAAEAIPVSLPPTPLQISGNPPSGTVNVAYTTTLSASGGIAPYSFSLSSGSLPAGLTLVAATGVISGTPTASGTSIFTGQVQDASGSLSSASFSITIAPSGQVLGLSLLPDATVGVPYNATIGVSGGVAPYTCTQTGGTLPAGLTLSASCVVSGTPTTAGTSVAIVTASDSSNPAITVTGPESITVAAAGSLTLSSPPNATVGVVYSGTIGVAGGTGPYNCTLTGGALPAGLTLGAGCLVSGTPTAAGISSLTVTATDSGSPQRTTTGPVTLTVLPGALKLTLATLPAATVGVPYTATVGVSGGVAPYTCLQTGGTLPAGLNLSANCVVSGTPTAAGTSTFNVQASDSSSPTETVTGPESITVSPAGSLTITGPPAATVGTPYTGSIGVSGGTTPYTCVLTAGTMPAGLTLGGNCGITGTPTTAGTTSVTVKATDTSSPVKTTSSPVVLVVNPAPLSLTMSTLPGASVGVPYNATIGVSGGSSPYSCAQVSGSLPAGLMLYATCVVSGTPTTAGNSTVQVKATDSSLPVETATGPESITVAPAPLVINSTLPNATVGTPYSATVSISGGTSPYSCSLAEGTLPAGLTLSTACVVSGTPTVAGAVTLSIRATDSSNPALNATGPVGLTVLAAPPTLTITAPPNATVNVPYTGTIGVTGGNAPYTCLQTGGTLPAGLALSSSCVVSGTPTTAGTVTITVKATDSSSPGATDTAPVSITVLAATTTLTLSSPPNATVTVPYTGTIGVAGGTAPYTCTQVGGTLPAGLSMNAACVVSGTPTVTGTTTVQIHAVDSATPTANTVTGPVSITVSPIPTLTLSGSLPNATVGVAYSQTLVASGGIKPYTFSLTAGALPAGLNLSTGGTISGTPTAPGASSFTVTVTDTESTPQTASLPLVLLVVYPTTTTDGEMIGPYAFLFQGYDDVAAGVLAYQTATIGSMTADGTGVISDGELDANHQSSNPTGNTVSSQQFVGTYTLGTDNRGYMAITPLNADGTTGTTSIYAITAKAPVAPATVSTQLDMIEFDDNGLQGTRGSGSILAQQSSVFSAGLTGGYAFGLSGDTPCLPSCTIGIVAGPVAAVGQFTTDDINSITAGASDANIATTNYANAALSGSYGTADANGRLDLTLNTAGTPNGIYPADYAVYLVNANQAFVMSIDKHSAYLLLAGTAQSQTQASFSDASMNAAFVGYENAQSDPGLLGVALQNVLNLSTATIFRATGNGAGACDFTNVDVAGLTGLVDGLTGLGSGATIQNALLGKYQSTGNSTCTVAANGRGVLNYPNPNTVLDNLLKLLNLSVAPPPPREFYLISPNSGYFLETGYAGLGRFEQQTGSPYSTASLDGTFVYASQPAASLASINTSGILVADGAGHATETYDANVGAGTLNVLQTDVTNTTTYSLTDATAGRFILGTTFVIYEIAPGRFVMVDTNILTTSPGISLLF
jgi:large repetitive protein